MNKSYVRGVVSMFILAPACAGDADGSGIVNFADITSVLTNFNLTCP